MAELNYSFKLLVHKVGFKDAWVKQRKEQSFKFAFAVKLMQTPTFIIRGARGLSRRQRGQEDGPGRRHEPQDGQL